MTYLAQYLTNQHGFSYVLPGKFCSDPIEGRFGWYRQVNSGNFFMSINQFFQAEKKIRRLSLIEKEVMFRATTLASHPDSIQGKVGDDRVQSRNDSWLFEFFINVDFDQFTELDACVAYYVSVNGYIGRSVCRRKKSSYCKKLLVMQDDDSSLEEQVIANSSDLLLMANRGGSAVPSQYCFALCSFTMQLYFKMSDDPIKKKFLTLSNQRTAAKSAQESEYYGILSSQICDEGHKQFILYSIHLSTALQKMI